MSAPQPQIRTVDDIKSALLEPALTSHYECFFTIPDSFASIRQGTAKSFIQKSVQTNDNLLTLSCSEATLPGSNLATHELNNDFTGVTQRHAYRRLYDDRSDFTFYVNPEYQQIRIFERWMQFIVGEEQSTAPRLNNFYRVMYPKSYKTTIYITKFERKAKPKLGKDVVRNDSYNSKKLYYSFFNAFPISIGSMPVSYESSQLLKVTVSFTYDRYLCSPISSSRGVSDNVNLTSPSVEIPNVGQNSSYWNSNSLNQAQINTDTLSFVNFQGVNFGNLSSGTFTNTAGFDNLTQPAASLFNSSGPRV